MGELTQLSMGIKPKPSGSTSLFSKALTAGGEWEKAELLDAIHWVRQVVALMAGIAAALLPLRGYVGFISFGVMQLGLVSLYYNSFLGVDPDQLEAWNTKWELMQSGFMPAFGVFVLTWVTL